jgi:hypothetical protein
MTAADLHYDWTHCVCGRELVILRQTQSGGPNPSWSADLPFVVALAECGVSGHAKYLLQQRGTLLFGEI